MGGGPVGRVVVTRPQVASKMDCFAGARKDGVVWPTGLEQYQVVAVDGFVAATEA